MKHKLGLPYMGSKRKIAKEIVGYIRTHNPKAKYFYDLCGGGGAISFEAMQYKQFNKVHYNEFNKSIVELLLKIKKEGVTDEFYKWINRDTYNKFKDDETWLGGLIATCWSFGNNKSKGYLFGEKIEETKRLMHEIVVNKCENSLLKFNELVIEIDRNVFNLPTIAKRRLYIQNMIKTLGIRLDFEQLQNIQQLQQLQNIQQLIITNLSYEQVEINTPTDETIIYLDPPYKSTAKYQKELDHDKLLEWVKNSPYKIYVSSYEYDLPCVHEIKHSSTLSATNNSKKVIEKIFCNRPEHVNNKLF